jgi:hypothetical protein
MSLAPFHPFLFLLGPAAISLWHLHRSVRLLRDPHAKGSIRRRSAEYLSRLKSSLAKRRTWLTHRLALSGGGAFSARLERWTPFPDQDGVIARTQWLLWILPGLLLVSAPTGGRMAGVFSVLLGWLFAWCAAALMSAGAFVSQRRRGLLDLELTSLLEPREMYDRTLIGVFWQSRRVLLIPVVAQAWLLVRGSLGPGHVVASTCFAATFLVWISTLGLATSLSSGAYLAPLATTFAMGAGAFFVPAIGSGPTWGGHFQDLMCILSAVFGVVAIGLARKRWTSPWILSRFFAVWILGWTLAILLVQIDATATLDWAILTSPIVLTILCLDPNNGTLSQLLPQVEWSLFVLTLAMIGSIAWNRWWTIRRFDELTGRVIQRAQSRKIGE